MRISIPLTLISVALLVSACRTKSSFSFGESFGEPRKDELSDTGFYIPRDLFEAMTELDRILGEEGRANVRAASEDDMIRYHMGVGTWIRNNWGLWHESRLARYFEQLGIHHADDMSCIIFDSYWRKIHNKPINLDGQVRSYQEYWKKEKSDGVS